MEFTNGNLYHIYNRGNNKKLIFFQPANYLYFLQKVRKFILPYCDLLSYALMPNHFHFLIHANAITELPLTVGNIETNPLSEGIRHLLSSYAKGINNQEKKTGSLFQQNTKSKLLIADEPMYSTTCFHYIHQNAWKAGLVRRMEDWPYSSFKDYAGLRNGSLCNRALAEDLLLVNTQRFYIESYEVIQDYNVNALF